MHSIRRGGRAAATALAGAGLLVAGLVLPAGADDPATPNDTAPEAPEVVSDTGGAIIDNGTIMLGVHDEGHLNVFGGPPSTGTGTTAVGLRYIPTGAEFTAPGCLCEGWGAGDATTGNAGWANEDSDFPSINNIVVESATFTATEATTVGLVGDPAIMRVTHHYYPAPETPNLYRVDVTVENISSDPIDLKYRRVMDWDIEPTAFSEYSTIIGGEAADDVESTSNDGFETSNPLVATSDISPFPGEDVDFVDAGPRDHGANFTFGFGELPVGGTQDFVTYYGAAGDETGALAALAAVGAEVYSLGQPSSSAPEVGAPNTAIFAFGDVGGVVTIPSARFASSTYSVSEDAGPATIGVELTTSPTDPVEVDVVSSDGTATAPGDYGSVVTTLTFAPGETFKTFPVPIVDDAMDEPDETVELDIVDVRGAFVGSPAMSTLTILDDDDPVGTPLCNGLVPTIVGTDAAETIHGTAGDDVILALGGDDKIYSKDGNDTVCAGEGNDLVYTGWGHDYVEGEGGDDDIYTGGHGDEAHGGMGDDEIWTNVGNDIATGGPGNDYLHSTLGRDHLIGGAGNDRIVGGAGNDVLEGNDDDDKLFGNDGDDDLYGGSGLDVLFGAAGDDLLDGGADDDRHFAGDDSDTCVDSSGGTNLNKDCEAII